jgi:hypothetical protein
MLLLELPLLLPLLTACVLAAWIKSHCLSKLAVWLQCHDMQTGTAG